MPEKIEIAPKTIIIILALLVGVWVIVQIKDILFLIAFAFILMTAMKPGVDFLEKFKIPKTLSIGINYLFIMCILLVFGTFIFPPLILELTKFVSHVPEYVSNAVSFINSAFPYLNLDQETLAKQLSVSSNNFLQQVLPIGQNVVRLTIDITRGVVSHVFAVLTIAVFTFYFLLERHNLRSVFETFFGQEFGDRLIVMVRRIETQLGAWIRGELILMVSIGISSYIGLTLLGVHYAIPLAIIAGLLEVVPIIGPTISAIPAALVALTISPSLFIAVIALYIIIQQIENNLLVPTVMSRVTGISPLVSLVALMIGGKLAGTAGIILAVPALLVLQTLIQEILHVKK